MPNLDSQAKLVDAETLQRECGELEDAIQVLRARFEQYFLGVDRAPPTAEHRALKARLNKLATTFVRSTATKFRVQSLQARFLTYERLWTRTLQEMEAGTYRRDVFKARLHQKNRGVAPPAPLPAPLNANVAKTKEVEAPSRPVVTDGPPAPGPAPKTGSVVVFPAAVTSPPAPKSGPFAAPAPKSGAFPAPGAAAASSGTSGALSDAKVKAIYDAYMTAKKQCQEDTSRLSLDSVAATLRKQVPDLLKKHNAKGIDFKVVIKDGKATLKAIPKV